MSKSNDDAVVFGVGLLAGIAAGAVLAVLCTPKSGEEVRKDLKDTVSQFVDEMPRDYKKTEEQSKELIFKVKYSIENQINKINNALKAAKIAAAKRKEEMESEYNY